MGIISGRKLEPGEEKKKSFDFLKMLFILLYLKVNEVKYNLGYHYIY